MLNLGILISGRGSNMEAILNAVRERDMPANPAIIISNNPNAKGLKVAERLGAKTAVISSKGFSGSREEYDKLLAAELRSHGVTRRNGLVCLAGFMRLVSPQFVETYRNRILNVHPALLPAFPGLESQRQAVEYGAKVSGCTVHIVDAGMDTGPIVVQKAVQVRNGDTAASLARRILEKEHEAYPEAVELFASGRVRVSGRRVSIKPPAKKAHLKGPARRKSTQP